MVANMVADTVADMLIIKVGHTIAVTTVINMLRSSNWIGLSGHLNHIFRARAPLQNIWIPH